MNLKTLLAALFLASCVFTSCSNDDDKAEPAPAPQQPTNNNPQTTSPAMTAKVNGTDWTAAVPVATLQGGDFTLAGSNMSGHAIGMYAMGANISQPGTYSVVAVYSEIAPGQTLGPTWAAPQGTVTISKLDLTAKKISGTFSFIGFPEPTSGASGMKTISTGVFTDIALQ